MRRITNKQTNYENKVMKKFLPFAASILLLMSACNNGMPDQIEKKHLVGLWGISWDKQADNDGRYDQYFNFKEDGTFEYYKYQDSSRYYHRGIYGTVENASYFYVTYQQFRSFMFIDNIARCILDYDDKSHWVPTRFVPTAMSKKMITLQSAKPEYVHMYFHAADKIPSDWPAEFSASEITLSSDALIHQWDQVNYFEVKGDETTYFYYYEPENMGITFLPDGGLTKCVFFANSVWQHQHDAGAVTDSESITIRNEDCSWTLGDDKVTLTCTQYLKYTNNQDGGISSPSLVTPDEPIALDFKIHELTDYYLILHNASTGRYHVFHKNSSPKQNVRSLQDVRSTSKICGAANVRHVNLQEEKSVFSSHDTH